MINKQKKSKKQFTPIILTLSAITLIAASFVIGRGYFNTKYSEAESKNYNKTYPAGNIVNYKPTGVQYSQGKLRYNTSQGKNIKMAARPGGPTIDGWTMKASDDDRRKSYPGGWVYLSKWIPVPKTKKPVAVYVCWKALSRNTSVKFQLNKGINDVWRTKKGEYNINFYHGYESDPQRYRETACWGFYDIAYRQVVPRSHPQSEPIYPGQYMKKINEKIQVRIYMKVPEGGVEVASIKVIEPTKPPEKDGNGYPMRQFEADITR